MAVVVIRHSWRTLAAGWLSLGLFVGAIIAAALAADPEERWALWLCFGLTPPLLVLVVEGYRVRHVLGVGGIRYRGLIHEHTNVAWRSLVRADWSESMKWLTLYTNDGKVLRFSALLSDLDALATALAEHVPHLETDPKTSEMLTAARHGKVPQVWW